MSQFLGVADLRRMSHLPITQHIRQPSQVFFNRSLTEHAIPNMDPVLLLLIFLGQHFRIRWGQVDRAMQAAVPPFD